MRLIPWARAMLRTDQWVAWEGFVCRVASTTAWTLRGERLGIRPGRGASFSRPANRRARKRSRHSLTVGLEIRKACAMSWSNFAPAATEIIRARWTSRKGRLRLLDHAAK